MHGNNSGQNQPGPEPGSAGRLGRPPAAQAPCSRICSEGGEPRFSRSTWGPGKLMARADGGPLKHPRRSSKKGPSLAGGPEEGGFPEPSLQSHRSIMAASTGASAEVWGLAAPPAPTSPGWDGKAPGDALEGSPTGPHGLPRRPGRASSLGGQGPAGRRRRCPSSSQGPRRLAFPRSGDSGDRTR